MQSEAALAPGIARRLAKELAALETAAPEGVKVESSDQLSVVYAYLKGPSDTPFAGGVFKIRLVYGPEFPSAPPKGDSLSLHTTTVPNHEETIQATF